MRMISTMVLLGLVLAANARSSVAQPSGSAAAEADALFNQGRQLLEAGKFEEACNAFDASQKLAPAISTLFNQAHCREKNNQLATAWGLFREAERMTRAPLDEATQNLNKVATQRAADLEPRLSKLTIVVPPDARLAGLVVERDKSAIEPGAFNRALPIDGGTYQLVARAPGHIEWTHSVTVEPERDAKTVEVPKLEKVPPPPPPPPGSTVGAKPSLRVPLLLGGGGIALLGAALGIDLWARSEYEKSQKEANDPRQESLWEGAKTKRYIAQGVAVAGIGCVGVAVWLYVRGRRSSESPPVAARGARVEPVVGAEQIGVQLLGRF